MRAIHLLLVSMLGLGGIATAAAGDVAVSNIDANCTHQSSSDGAASRDSSNSHSDASLSHTHASRNAPTSTASSSMSNGDGGINGGGGGDASPKRASLGWQSLLPGSIQ
jgi:hypothetical protein